MHWWRRAVAELLICFGGSPNRLHGDNHTEKEMTKSKEQNWKKRHVCISTRCSWSPSGDSLLNWKQPLCTVGICVKLWTEKSHAPKIVYLHHSRVNYAGQPAAILKEGNHAASCSLVCLSSSVLHRQHSHLSVSSDCLRLPKAWCHVFLCINANCLTCLVIYKTSNTICVNA